MELEKLLTPDLREILIPPDESIIPSGLKIEEIEDIQLDLIKRPDFIVEANFLNIPIFKFDKNQRGKKNNFAINHIVERIDDKSTVTRKVVVSVAPGESAGKEKEDRLPGAFDHDVWLVLMDLWDEQGRADNGKVYFKIGDICRRLTIDFTSGNNLKRVVSSISRLKRTIIESKNAYYSMETSKYVSHSVNLLDSAYTETKKGKSRKIDDLCYVVISKFVLDNLKRDYTAKINRRLYQQLSLGFSKRISNLITYRKQVKNEYGSFDFALDELASKLPISGKAYPSKVLERLRPTIKELEKKGLFSCEVIDVNGEKYIRFVPLHNEDALMGAENIKRFSAMVKEVYKVNINEFFDLEDDDLETLIKKYDKEIQIKKRKYSWCYHVMTILLHQMVRGNYKTRSENGIGGLLVSMLKKDDLDLPLKFKPLDVEYEEVAREREIKTAVMIKQNEEKEKEKAIVNLTNGYYEKLSKPQKTKYLKRLDKEHGDMMRELRESEGFRRGIVMSYIAEDIKNGEEIDIL